MRPAILKQRRFAVTVKTDDTHTFAGIHNEVEIVDYPHRTVPSRQTADVQHLALSGRRATNFRQIFDM